MTTAAAHRRAKIVCTLGPATENRLADLIVTGMDDGYGRGDGVVIVAGAPPHTIGVTDLLRVHRT